ncbi:hypothetical protein CO174_01165 [Candidatus Uhrbacteria bacterium CG_4_9_14_3_um_filter_50_9]|uniref:Uncharacterized protein n=1 Tax=Candidatus Uhrbacteria bacterium CG_4_9_14_3_um_filter_50_9 TaxID=1975035 RepID=A0A2M7XDL2_9BACT|nr:MAG: hypothetical protein CO174_01165 [Candidatus Uhrbacteria bacterium CG_4_9_14_3_um_filter_50_9]
MKSVYAILTSVVFLGGCGLTPIDSPVNTQGLTGSLDLSLVANDVSEVEPIPASWATYQNEAYGYQFSYPADGILWSTITEGPTSYVISPTTTSRLVQFTDASIEFLLETEVNKLVVEVIDGQRSAHEWLSLHLHEYYYSGNAGQNVISFGGESAIELIGQGFMGSPAKMIVQQRGECIYVIYYLWDSFTFEDVLDTFMLI